jgi:hypothetical protein
MDLPTKNCYALVFICVVDSVVFLNNLDTKKIYSKNQIEKYNYSRSFFVIFPDFNISANLIPPPFFGIAYPIFANLPP